MLDLVSNGRVDFGIGEGATRLELGGFHIPAREKRAMALEAAEQIADMMVMSPYPGYEGKSFRMPCRNVLPKPLQQPHPPMWMACTNRDTIRIAASKGLGALAFSFVDPDEARTWSKIYYDTIRSEDCVPLGHRVNANIAMVSAFSLHEDRNEAIRRGQESFEFFVYALGALVTQDSVPGRTDLWGDFRKKREASAEAQAVADANGADSAFRRAPGIGTPDDFRAHIRNFEEAGVDQIILLQQAGRNPHAGNLRGVGTLCQNRPARVQGKGGSARGGQSARTCALHRGGAGAKTAPRVAGRHGHSRRPRVGGGAAGQSGERRVAHVPPRCRCCETSPAKRSPLGDKGIRSNRGLDREPPGSQRARSRPGGQRRDVRSNRKRGSIPFHDANAEYGDGDEHDRQSKLDNCRLEVLQGRRVGRVTAQEIPAQGKTCRHAGLRCDPSPSVSDESRSTHHAKRCRAAENGDIARVML